MENNDCAGMKVRFAPSPTGILHIGGVRTAVFNHMFARKHKGRMLIRIDDTDRERSTPENIDIIMNELKWLGLISDDTVPVMQSDNLERHREVAYELLNAGKAYKCFATKEELDEMRQQATREKRPPLYDGRWRDRDPAEAPEGAPFVIRIKSPDGDGSLTVDDLVQGKVQFPHRDMDDFILLRSDGMPTFMLATVVDDHDMDITHIIRGDDHFTNTARQLVIYDAMGWKCPVTAHIPLIHGKDGGKLSKRHGAVGVDHYREKGYFKEALLAYLSRLSWSHPDLTDEFDQFTYANTSKLFGFENVGKSPAKFDFAKLDNINSQILRDMNDGTLVSRLLKFAGDPYFDGEATQRDRDVFKMLIKAMPTLKTRAVTLADLKDASEYIRLDLPVLDESAVKLLDSDASMQVLVDMLPKLDSVSEWNKDELEPLLNSYAEQKSMKLKDVAQPLRAALTGRTKAQGMYDIFEILGRERTLERIQHRIG